MGLDEIQVFLQLPPPEPQPLPVHLLPVTAFVCGIVASQKPSDVSTSLYPHPRIGFKNEFAAVALITLIQAAG